MKKSEVKKISLSAMFMAIGIILPFFTGQIKEIGDSILPMHIPVMLCGLICGAKYGFITGALLPIVRSLTVSMPPLYPNAVWMAVELATYGFVIGLMYNSFQKKQLWWLYTCLIASMLCGRISWGIAKVILLGMTGKMFTLQAFLVGGFIDSIPGIILQLILVPAIVMLIGLNKGKNNV